MGTLFRYKNRDRGISHGLTVLVFPMIWQEVQWVDSEAWKKRRDGYFASFKKTKFRRYT